METYQDFVDYLDSLERCQTSVWHIVSIMRGGMAIPPQYGVMALKYMVSSDIMNQMISKTIWSLR